MKLFVAGCSLSDYTKVDKVYGEYLAEKLNCEYVHEGAGCGSNYRIWRRIVNHILDGNLTSDDLLIVQYTGTDRREFWSANPPMPPREPYTRLQTQEPSYNGGSYIRYKYGAHVWQDYPEEKQLFELYENNFVNPRYEAECFRVYNVMFQHLLMAYKIKTVFTRARSWHHDPKTYLPLFTNYLYSEPEEFRDDKITWLSMDDPTHLSQLGHELYSERLYKHIQKTGILNGMY